MACPPTPLPPVPPDNRLTPLISNTVILRCQWGSQWLHQITAKGPGEGAGIYPTTCSVLASQAATLSLCCGPSPLQTPMAGDQASFRRSQSRRPLIPQPGRKDGLGSLGRLHQLLGFKEALEVSHLPDADGYENEGLQDRPPQHPLVGALAGLPEAFLSPLWEGRKEDKPELAGPHLGPLELLGSLPRGCPRAN